KSSEEFAERRSIVPDPRLRNHGGRYGCSKGGDHVCGPGILLVNVEERVLRIVEDAIVHVVTEKAAQLAVEIVVHTGGSRELTQALPSHAGEIIRRRVQRTAAGGIEIENRFELRCGGEHLRAEGSRGDQPVFEGNGDPLFQRFEISEKERVVLLDRTAEASAE